jgi:hypothetical protein
LISGNRLFGIGGALTANLMSVLLIRYVRRRPAAIPDREAARISGRPHGALSVSIDQNAGIPISSSEWQLLQPLVQTPLHPSVALAARSVALLTAPRLPRSWTSSFANALSAANGSFCSTLIEMG